MLVPQVASWSRTTMHSSVWTVCSAWVSQETWACWTTTHWTVCKLCQTSLLSSLSPSKEITYGNRNAVQLQFLSMSVEFQKRKNLFQNIRQKMGREWWRSVSPSQGLLQSPRLKKPLRGRNVSPPFPSCLCLMFWISRKCSCPPWPQQHVTQDQNFIHALLSPFAHCSLTGLVAHPSLPSLGQEYEQRWKIIDIQFISTRNRKTILQLPFVSNECPGCVIVLNVCDFFLDALELVFVWHFFDRWAKWCFLRCSKFFFPVNFHSLKSDKVTVAASIVFLTSLTRRQTWKIVNRMNE